MDVFPGMCKIQWFKPRDSDREDWMLGIDDRVVYQIGDDYQWYEP